MFRYLGIVILMLITGCIPLNPVVRYSDLTPCDDIIYPSLLDVPFNELAQKYEIAEMWILTEFPTATVTFDGEGLTSSEEIGIFSWSANGKGFRLKLTSPFTTLNQISSIHPTIGQLIQCYGEPNYYTLEQDVPIGAGLFGNLLELWYTNLGLQIQTATTPREARYYDVNTIMAGPIVVTPPGSVEEMFRNAGPIPNEYVEAKLSALHEWPEDFIRIPLGVDDEAEIP